MSTECKILYHYTDVGALASMCQEDGICLRMTNTNCLNDKEELIIGYDLLHHIYPENRLENKDGSELHSEYVVSLSKAKDCLPMWTTYGNNGNGVAIGFNEERLTKWLEEHAFPHDYCIYDKSLFRSKLDEEIPPYYWDKDKQLGPLAKIYAQVSHDSLVCLLLKNPAFCYEEEFRIAKYVDPRYPSKNQNIKFRDRNGILVPFIELKLPYNLLECVMLGPTNNYSTNQVTVDLLLKCKGVGNVKVKHSSIPYRE